MRIQNNIAAMNTHRQYTINNNNVSKSVSKLSSGYRINSAADDAAGLAISEKMRAQIRGLTMASKNSADAVSLVQTAEGALQTTHDILQRMREIAVQSASDSNENTIDRAALDQEFQQLMSEIDDTASKTAFNDQKLIDGTFDATFTGTSAVTASTGTATPALGTVTDATLAFARDATAAANNAKFNGAWTFATNTDGYITATNGTTSEVLISTTKLTDALASDDALVATFGGLGTLTITADDDIASGLSSATLGTVTIAGAAAKVDEVAPGKNFVVQTGANSGDELSINIKRMNAEALGLKSAAGVAIGVSSQTDASDAITSVNDAINKVSTQRSELGALQNRLEFKIQNLDISAENLTSAESRIRDVDMAKEMTTFTKNNILSQAATAMLAQANSLPQGVLQLLG